MIAGILFAALPSGAAELETASVEIEVAEQVTEVEASYRVAADEQVRFHLRRLPGQDIRFPQQLGSVSEAPGAMVLAVEPLDSEIVLRYEIRGERSRVPLFVPAAVASGAIEIRLRGAGGDLALRAGFPRFLPAPDGELVARPSDLPSFVRLPPRRDQWNVHRGAEILVVLLVVGATTVWILRQYPLFSIREPE